MATLKVGFENPSLRLFDGAKPFFEVFGSELVTARFGCGVPIPTIKDHSLIKPNWFVDARLSDAGFKVLEVLSLDHGKHVGEGVGCILETWWPCWSFGHGLSSFGGSGSSAQ
jgi:hypothetical protein